MIQISKYLNFEQKGDFYNKKILSVRFCGLFLHRNWRTRGFRKPVTVEHFQLN